MSATELTPPSSPTSSLNSTAIKSGTSTSPQPISRSRRLKHSKSPIFPSPDYRIPHTSLYQFPSDGSLTSLHASHSNARSPTVPLDTKMFTAVIPPLAAVPPTAPLPPTPPKQGVWEELVTKEIMKTHKKRKAQPKVELIVGIIKDVRAEKESEKQKRGLRRMKGNVGDAAIAQTTTQPRIKTPTRSTAQDISADSGLPTPGSTPPFSVTVTTPPRTLHHPIPYKLPVRKLEYNLHIGSSNSNTTKVGRSDEDDDDDDDGGITIEYEDEAPNLTTSDRGRKPAVAEPARLSIPGIDIPRPDSPFITGFALELDEQKGPGEYEIESPTQYHYESDDEGVRLSACKKSFPEFIHSPKRVDSDKAELVEEKAEELDSEIRFKSLRENTSLASPVVSVKQDKTSVGTIQEPVSPQVKEVENGSKAIEDISRENRSSKVARSKPNVDLIINRSTILKRRHPSASFKGTEEDTDESEKLLTPSLQAESWLTTQKGSVQPSANPTGANTPSIFAPPQLPRFNFIPATPLPLMSPSAVLDKQLGEHSLSLVGTAIAEESESPADMPPTPQDTSTAAAKAARPSIARSKTVRDSRLHPWWRPKYYYHEEDANFAKLLEGTSFAPTESSSKASEWDIESMNDKPSTPKSEWTEYGPVRIDKKRKLVGVGGVQIQWVGLGGWYERIVGGKKNENPEPGENKVNLKRKGWIDF